MLGQIPLLALSLLVTTLFAIVQHGDAAAASSTSTMTTTISSASSSSSTSGTAHDIDVGNGGLKFSPDTLTASTGDTINFHFYPQNHSVIQSSFNSPCMPLSSGNTAAIFSGFMPVSGPDEGAMLFSMMVNTTDPIWLYCGQDEHCQAGMDMVVNPPSGGSNTLDAYKQAAKGVQKSESPATGIMGGVVMANSESGSGNSSMSSGTMTSSRTGSATGARTSAASSSSASSSSSSAASASSAAGTSAAPGVVRPFPGVVTVLMLLGLGFLGACWTLL